MYAGDAGREKVLFQLRGHSQVLYVVNPYYIQQHFNARNETKHRKVIWIFLAWALLGFGSVEGLRSKSFIVPMTTPFGVFDII